MRLLMALFGRTSEIDKRMAALDARGQVALTEADLAVAKAHKIALQEARIQRESQQYSDRLLDRRTA